MTKRAAWLHVDLAGLEGDLITHSLLHHRAALRELGFKTPVHQPDEGWRARVEMLRLHKEHGLRRRDVEGTWAEICRRAWKGRKVPLLSVPGFGSADAGQVALVLDILHGLKVHVVATMPAATTPEHAHVLDVALSRWESRLKPGRTHPLHVGADDWPAAWAGFAELAGFDPGELPLLPTPLSAAARRPRQQSAT